MITAPIWLVFTGVFIAKAMHQRSPVPTAEECASPTASPDIIAKGGDGVKERCFTMFAWVVKHDRTHGECAFEALISDDRSEPLKSYTTLSLFGVSSKYQSVPGYRTNDCDELDTFDNYDTLKISATYKQIVAVLRWGGRGAECYDFLPYFKIEKVAMIEKGTYPGGGTRPLEEHSDCI